MKGKLLKKLLAVSLSTTCIGSALVSAAPLAYANEYTDDVFTTIGAIGTLTGGWDADVDMTDPDGDGIYTCTIKDVKAGDYEFKVRADDCWDLTWSVYDDYWETTSYPGGDNISVSLAVDTDVTIMFDTRGNNYEMWPISYKYTDENGKEVTVFTGYDASLKNNSSINEYYTNYLRAGQECELDCYFDAKGGTGSYQFAVYIYNQTKGWKQIKDYCSDYGWSYFYFTPEVEGENTIRIKVKDSEGNVVNKDFPVNVKTEFENTSSVGSNVISVGDELGISCESYGSGEKQYAAYAQRAGTTQWKTVRDYGTSDYFYWEPTEPGVYKLRVKAKNEAGKISDKDFTILVCATSYSDYNSVASDYVFFDNTDTKWSKVYAFWWNEYNESFYDIANNNYHKNYPGVEMTRIGNTDFYQARMPFNAYPSDDYSDKIRFSNGNDDSDFRETSEIDFDPFENAGQVYTVDSSVEPVVNNDYDKPVYSYNKGSWKAYTGAFTSENIFPELVNDSWCDDTVSLSGFYVRNYAYGGVGNKTYAVYYKKSGKTTWTKVSDYSDAYNTQVFLPEEGDYTIRVKAKDTEGTVVNKDISVKAVKVPLSIDYLYHNSEYSYGRMIYTSDFDVDYSGGVGQITKTLYYKQTKQTNWTKAGAEGFTPKALTTYDVKMVITDSLGDTAEKATTIKIVAPRLYNYSYLYPEEIDLGDSTEITVTADYYGGYGDKTYEVYYKLESENEYKRLESSSGTYYVYFKPDAVGTYDIRVKAKDALGTEADKDLKLKVLTPVFKNLSYLNNNTVSLGRSVYIDFGSKNGQGEVQYAVYYKLKSKTAWTKACDYNNEDGYSLKLDTEGVYDVRIKAKDEAGKVVNKDESLEVKLIPLENDSYISYSGKWDGKDCSIADGCWVYGDSYGGVGDVLYSVYYKKSGSNTWTKVTDYNNEYSTKVMFPDEGSYTIRVKAKDEKGTVVNKDIDIKVTIFPLTLEVREVPVGFDNDSLDGVPYSFGANANGGFGKRQYAFYYKQKTQEKWTKAADYSEDNYVTVYPKSETTYQIKAVVKDEKGNTAESIKEFEMKIPELVNNSWLSQDQIELGESTYIGTYAYGGYGKKQYAVYYKLENETEWSTFKDFNDSDYVYFTADKIGTYDVKVTAKDKKGKTADKSFKVKIIAPVYENTSWISYSTLGQPVKIYFSSRNGTGNVEYAAYYKLHSSTKWILICDYSMINRAKFTPSAEGQYDLRVKAKDEDGRIDNMDESFTIRKGVFTNNSRIEYESISDTGDYNLYVEREYDIITNSSNAIGEVKYEVSYQKEGQTEWTLVSDYSTDSRVYLTLPETGKYLVRVTAKDEEGNQAEIMFPVAASKMPLHFTVIDYERSGKSFVFYPSVEGGEGEKQFALYYKQKKQSNWTKASDYKALGEGETLTFTPKAFVVYDVKVLAKDSKGTVIEDYLEIDNQLQELVNDSYLDDEEIYLGDNAYVNLSSSGGYGTLKYTVTYKQESQTTWTTTYDQVSDRYSYCSFTPKAAKTYDVKVVVTDEKGRTAEKLFKLKVKPASFINESYVYGDTVGVGNRVNVYNYSRFGSGLVTYSVFYRLHEATTWTRICSDTTAEDVYFVPKTAGLYDIRVKAKDETGKVVNKDLSITAEELIFRNDSYISEYRMSSDFYSAKATLTDGCSVYTYSYNGYGNVLYAVYTKKFGQTKWTLVSDYSDKQYVPLTFESTGVYAVRVIAKDEKERTDIRDYSVEVVDAPLTISSSYCDYEYYDGEYHAYAYVNAFGGKGKKQYAAYYKQASQTNWTKIADFQDDGNFNFKPKSFTTYNVKLIAKDAAGNTAEKILEITLRKQELINTSYLDSSEIDLGDPINIYARSYGGAKGHQYAAYYRREDQTKWNKLSDYTSEAKFSFVPNVKAAYIVRVKVKDSAGTVANRDLKFTVVAPVFRNLSYVNEIQYLGEPVVVTCRSKGGTGTVQHAVYYKKSSQTTWTKASDYSTNENVSINISEIGIYDVRVKAKDSTGAIVNKDFSFRMVYGTPRNISSLKSDVIRLQDSATVLCNSKRGHGTVKFAVYYRRSDARYYTLVSDYSTNKTVSFKPGAVGEYEVRVDAMDEDGAISNKYLTLTVKNADFVNSSYPAYVYDDGEVYPTSYLYGDSLTVFHNSIGGTGTVQYAVFYKEADETTWTKGADYTSAASSAFKVKFKNSSKSTKFTLRIKAKDSSNRVVNRDFEMYYGVGGQK